MTNLFRNPSFEEGFYEYHGIENLRVPIDWEFWYAPEDYPNPIDSAPHSVFRQPEAHVLHLNDIPEYEHQLFFWDGEYTWKIFKREGSLYIRLIQSQNLEPGRYRITVNLFPDLVMRYENDQKVAADSVDAGLMRFYAGGPIDDFWTMFPYLERKTYSVEFDAAGEMEIGAEFMLPFALLQNGLFTDMWTLERLGSPSPMYDRVFHLFHHTITDAEFEQVKTFALPYDTMGQSADDAAHTAPSLASRTIHVWRAGDWGGRKALERWILDNYPPLPTMIYHEYADKPEPPLLSRPGTMLGLHLQTEYEGWEEYIAETKPAMVKLFQFEPARRVKQLSPDTIVAVRHFLRHQEPYLFAEDKRAAAKNFIGLFRDSLFANAEYVDVMLELNEYIGTDDITGIQNGVAWAVAFAQELAALKIPVVPGLLSTAVGNPREGDQTRMLIPAARAAVEYGGYLYYHSYWSPGKLEQDWKWMAGRALEIWDVEFRAARIYPKYAWGEIGVVGQKPDGGLEPAAGWKDPLAYNGDWPRYQTDLLRFDNKVKSWNSRYGNRARGGSIFTTGADFVNWLSFQIRTPEMESLENALT